MNGQARPGDRLSTDFDLSTQVDVVRVDDVAGTADVIRVASVPASHVYVRHLAPHMGTDGVVRLDDPIPADGRKVPGGWWPPVMLDPGWIREHHHLFDLFHVHFGFDAIAPQVMEDIVHELHSHEIPLVYTVHDLRNPHHPDPEPHRESWTC